MSDKIDRDAAIQAVFDWEQGKISGTIADAIAAIPATDAREKALREAAAVANAIAETSEDDLYWRVDHDRKIEQDTARTIRDAILSLIGGGKV